ncbi:HWE histidine kinase domain-containing protein [Bradyrhizobium pachyrhizi]|uniref:HWE histidine kinase domain-containing protein n=1 Tax=Bradyrhizobium pachyrhizi TaxID=280333 RepID=UPI003D360C64
MRLAKAETADEFRAAFHGRLAALTNVRRLFSASRWTGASPKKVVEDELHPYAGGKLDAAPARCSLDDPSGLGRSAVLSSSVFPDDRPSRPSGFDVDLPASPSSLELGCTHASRWAKGPTHKAPGHRLGRSGGRMGRTEPLDIFRALSRLAQSFDRDPALRPASARLEDLRC